MVRSPYHQIVMILIVDGSAEYFQGVAGILFLGFAPLGAEIHRPPLTG